MRSQFAGKAVFITGGTGSFGHWVVRELLKTDVEEVTVFSRDEEKQLDMKREFQDSRLNFIIGNVRDEKKVNECVRGDYIYHASALKIIPTCETFPMETIKTNMLGTLNVRNACIRNGVEKAILISTDKAVKPVNVYGMSKALSEKVWLKASTVEAKFSAVRYGNVLGTRGSIIPFFSKLIRERKPLPITDVSMRRFFLTLDQAIEFVFYATKQMNGGELFVPKNPACRIVDLAKAMAGSNYPIDEVGIRAGEKIDEVLISEEEIRRTKTQNGYFVVYPFGSYKGTLTEEFTSATAYQLSVSEIRELLGKARYDVFG